jgi:hypothetical protein
LSSVVKDLRKDAAHNYESGGQEFESLRARHFGIKLGTPKPAVFALDAATSVRSNTLLKPVMRTSFASTSRCWASARRLAVRRTAQAHPGITCADWSASQAAIASWQGRNHHNFNEHPKSPKVGREASPHRRVCRIDPLVPNRIVIFEQTHVSDPDLGAE